MKQEGLFRPEHKKPIPKFPKRVRGVVTASTGAAVRDIINVITRRYPMAEIVIYPAQVQGVGAAESVVKAIEYFNATNEVDTLIVGRGGGSISRTCGHLMKKSPQGRYLIQIYRSYRLSDAKQILRSPISLRI